MRDSGGVYITRREVLVSGIVGAASFFPLIGTGEVTLLKPDTEHKQASRGSRIWKSSELAHNLQPKDRRRISPGRSASIRRFKHPIRRLFQVQASHSNLPHGLRGILIHLAKPSSLRQ